MSNLEIIYRDHNFKAIVISDIYKNESALITPADFSKLNYDWLQSKGNVTAKKNKISTSLNKLYNNATTSKIWLYAIMDA